MECKISFQCIENQDKLTKLQQQNKELQDKLSKCKDAMFSAEIYYKSTRYCENNCDPSVNYHEPECYVHKLLFRTLKEIGES